MGCRTWGGFEIAPDGTRLYVSQKAGGVSRRALGPAASQRRVISAGGSPCTDGSHVYGTVTEALAAANPGDTLVVCPGSYAECVSVDRAVRLDAFAGPPRTYLRSVTVTGDSAHVAGFRLRALNVEGAVDVELWGNVVLGNEVYLPVVLKDASQT